MWELKGGQPIEVDTSLLPDMVIDDLDIYFD